jgi:hypothetical protein
MNLDRICDHLVMNFDPWTISVSASGAEVNISPYTELNLKMFYFHL